MIVRFNILGPVSATVDAKPVSLAPALRQIVALLCVEPDRTVSAERMTERLWADGETPRRPLKMVQGHLCRLRQLVGPDAVLSTAGGYRLGPTVSVDVQLFRQAVESAEDAAAEGAWADAERWSTDALAMWRGNLAENAGGALEPEYGAYLVLMASNTKALRVEACRRSGKFRAAVLHGQTMLMKDPTDELVCLEVMASYQAMQRTVEGLGAYARLRAALGVMGLTPSHALRSAEEKMVRGISLGDGGHEPELLASGRSLHG